MSPDRNDRERINKQMYASFYGAMRLRHERGNINGEMSGTLEPLTVLGRWHSDEFGMCLRLNRALFTDEDRAAMPAVMTDEEFWAFVDEHIRPRGGREIISPWEGSSSTAFPLPPPHIVCAYCAGTWDLATAHDIETADDFEDLDLSAFVGQTLEDVKRSFPERTDALRSFGLPLSVHNPQWVDPEVGHSIDETFATPEQLGWRTQRRQRHTEHPIPPEQIGWGDEGSQRPSITWEYVIQPGDRTSVFRYHFFHGICFRELKQEQAAQEAVDEREGLKYIFEQMGFENVRITLAGLPDHLRAWAATDLDDGETIDQVVAEFRYYRVKTTCGSLGVIHAAYPLLDLEGSGATREELAPEFSTTVPPDFPQIIGFSPEPEQLLRLWQLMTKNNRFQ